MRDRAIRLCGRSSEKGHRHQPDPIGLFSCARHTRMSVSRCRSANVFCSGIVRCFLCCLISRSDSRFWCKNERRRCTQAGFRAAPLDDRPEGRHLNHVVACKTILWTKGFKEFGKFLKTSPNEYGESFQVSVCFLRKQCCSIPDLPALIAMATRKLRPARATDLIPAGRSERTKSQLP